MHTPTPLGRGGREIASWSSWWDRPDLGQHAPEVAAEDALDLAVGILAAHQALGEVEHPLRMVEPLDVDLVAKPVAALVARPQLLVRLGRHVVVAIEVHV